MGIWQWRCGKRLIGRGRHVSDAGTRSRALEVVVVRLARIGLPPPNPFSPLNLPTAALPRTLYFDCRASLGWHMSTTPRLSTVETAIEHYKSYTSELHNVDFILHHNHCTTHVRRKASNVCRIVQSSSLFGSEVIRSGPDTLDHQESSYALVLLYLNTMK
jgi:hypothetical protein